MKLHYNSRLFETCGKTETVGVRHFFINDTQEMELLVIYKMPVKNCNLNAA